MGTPALFFYSVLCFFSDDINKLYYIAWSEKRQGKARNFCIFGGKKGRCPLYVHKNGGFAKNIDKKYLNIHI